MTKLTGRQELLIAVTNKMYNTGNQDVIETVCTLYSCLTQAGKDFANDLIGDTKRRFVADVKARLEANRVYEIADFR